MDWFEPLFGFAPDNGNGTLELLLMMVIAAATLAVTSRTSGAHIATRLLAACLAHWGSARAGY